VSVVEGGGRWEKLALGFGGSAHAEMDRLDVPDSFTIEAWVNTSKSDSTQRQVFNSGGNPAGYDNIVLAMNGGEWNAWVWDTSANNKLGAVSGNGGIQTDRWYHLVYACDVESGKAALYVDGELEDSTSWSDVYDGSHSVPQWGRHHSDVAHWEGLMDEPALYREALGGTDVKGNYKMGRP
jgi:hypothetical protein